MLSVGTALAGETPKNIQGAGMGEAKRRGPKEQRVADLLAANGVTAMTPERYNAFVAWTRSPIANDIGEELEFFSSADESLIGVLIKDLTDRDFGYVLLGRDLKGRFRCIDVDMSYKKSEARHALFASVKRHLAEGKTVFDQGDEAADKAGVDLFTVIAPEDKLHRAFKILQSLDHWIPARGIMTEMMKHYVDVDGRFSPQQMKSFGLLRELIDRSDAFSDGLLHGVTPLDTTLKNNAFLHGQPAPAHLG